MYVLPKSLRAQLSWVTRLHCADKKKQKIVMIDHLSWSASAHRRTAAESRSEAQLLHPTHSLAPFPGNLCSGAGPINASLRRVTLPVITRFLGQIIHSQRLPGSHHSCSCIRDRASASTAPAQPSPGRREQHTPWELWFSHLIFMSWKYLSGT